MRASAKMLALSSLLTLGLSSLALAQMASSGDDSIRPGHTPGVGPSYPLSPNASNITPGDTTSTIASTPPAPNVPLDASVQQLLMSASSAISAGQTGTGDEALEDAETKILTRSVVRTQADMPSADPVVAQIEQARTELGSHDKTGATQVINQILSSNAPELAD